MDVTNAETEAKRVKKFPVRLLKGYWPADGDEKLPSGAEIELPVDEAKSLIKRGLAARNDAL